MSSEEKPCFGFYQGHNNEHCSRCVAARRCKAVLISHGFTILGDLIDHMLGELPEGPYRATESVKELVVQLERPPSIALSAEEQALVGLLTPADGLEDLVLD